MHLTHFSSSFDIVLFPMLSFYLDSSVPFVFIFLAKEWHIWNFYFKRIDEILLSFRFLSKNFLLKGQLHLMLNFLLFKDIYQFVLKIITPTIALLVHKLESLLGETWKWPLYSESKERKEERGRLPQIGRWQV